MAIKYLQISRDTTLSDINDIVGPRNTQYILAANNLSWQPYVGREFYSMQDDAIANTPEVNWQRKSALLNSLSGSTDVFEMASLLSESGWKVLSTLDTLPGTLKIPETVDIPLSENIVGDETPVGRLIYSRAMSDLAAPPHTIDPGIFNEYSTIKASQIIDSSTNTSQNTFQYFNIPWGDITLYSSLTGESIDVPAYPEELSDSRKANYNTMPDMIYQYEPWYVYNSSGPRSPIVTFNLHRDMWSGDHTDGKANDLIRFCQANCYPEFNGSAVNVSQVTLYIVGQTYISGILTDVTVKWDGPILSDGWYAHFELELSFTEISPQALTYTSVRNMPLIG